MAGKNLTALMLAALISASFIACGEKSSENTPPPGGSEAAQTADNAGTEPETTADPLAKYDGIDYGGYKFRVVAQNTPTRYNMYFEEKQGDDINDSIFDRDLAVTEKLNVSFEAISYEDRGSLKTDVQKTILAGDDAYDMIITSLSDGINSLTTAGALFDLREMPQLSLDGPLWNASMYKNMSVSGRQFFTTGYITPQLLLTPIVMVFDKKQAENYQVGDLYSVVSDGKWTIEKLASLFVGVANDIDGDGKMTDADFFVMSLDGTFGNALYTAAGFNTVAEDNGSYTLTLDSQASIDLIDRCAGIFGDRETVFCDLDGAGTSQQLFKSGGALFLDNTILGVIALRELENDFGIIPNPKADESVDSYYTACNTWLPSGVAVPKTCPDPERTSVIMETMAFYSDMYMRPAAYEVTLKGKTSRDDASEAMLDLIYANTSFDFNTVFNFGDTSILLRASMLGEKSDFASKYAKSKEKAQKQLDKMVESVAAGY